MVFCFFNLVLNFLFELSNYDAMCLFTTVYWPCPYSGLVVQSAISECASRLSCTGCEAAGAGPPGSGAQRFPGLAQCTPNAPARGARTGVCKAKPKLALGWLNSITTVRANLKSKIEDFKEF